MKEASGYDNFAIAWNYTGQELEVIPVTFSRMTRPTIWPTTCTEDSECDDGFWCNGTLFVQTLSRYSFKHSLSLI
jgi:hypothetical protein